MAETDNSLLNLVNASGFLFQLRVEHEIRNTYGQHHWEIAGSEHRWIDFRSTDEHFIDLVLKQRRFTMAVECKRVRNGNWVFLAEKESTQAARRARLLWTYRSDSDQIADWGNFAASPNCQESAFCIVRGQGEKETSMLERLAGSVLASLEALARQELALPEAHRFENWAIYIPLIITTAELTVCRFPIDKVDLEGGHLPEDSAEFESIPFVRFRKGLTTNIPPAEPPHSLQELNQLNERAVFIVNAKEVSRFLSELQLSKLDRFGDWPWETAATRFTQHS